MELTLEWLRPWWLLAFIPAVFLIWRAWQTQAKQGAWHKVIDPKFQSLLLGSQANEQFTLSHKVSLITLASIWGLITLILAGPSIKSIEIPAQKSQQGTVILLDLSLSMLADDLPPSRLNRVKFKLTDLIKANPQESIGMVAYAGSAHAITPISEDNQTLLSLLPALNPVIMPHYGSNPIAGLNKADELFKGAHITDGHILWITDDIENEQIEAVSDWFQSNDYSLSILTVGTAQGGVVHIPNYGILKDDQEQVILPGLPSDRFIALSQSLAAPLSALKLEESDFDQLLGHSPNLAHKKTEQEAEQKTAMHPLDQGAALLIILVPLISLIYRRGWLFSFLLTSLLPLSLLGYSNPSMAENSNSQWDELGNMFQTHDQQAYKAWKKQNFEAAEALFENPQWQASSLYRLGRYSEAAKLFARDKTPKGFYNLGNALAKSGDFKGAQKAYQQALELQPDMESAKQNLEIIEKLLQEQKQEEQNNQSSEQQESNKSSNSQEAKESKQAKNANEQAETSQKDKPSKPDKQAPQSQANNNHSGAAKEPYDSSSDLKNEPFAEAPANNIDKSQASKPKETESASEKNNDHQAGSNRSNKTNESKEATATDRGSQQQKRLSESEAESGENKENPENSDKTPNRLSSENEQANDGETAGAIENTQQQEKQLATDNWIQQIPDSPDIFLKRKFQYQYNQMMQSGESNSDQATGSKTW